MCNDRNLGGVLVMPRLRVLTAALVVIHLVFSSFAQGEVARIEVAAFPTPSG